MLRRGAGIGSSSRRSKIWNRPMASSVSCLWGSWMGSRTASPPRNANHRRSIQAKLAAVWLAAADCERGEAARGTEKGPSTRSTVVGGWNVARELVLTCSSDSLSVFAPPMLRLLDIVRTCFHVILEARRKASSTLYLL